MVVGCLNTQFNIYYHEIFITQEIKSIYLTESGSSSVLHHHIFLARNQNLADYMANIWIPWWVNSNFGIDCGFSRAFSHSGASKCRSFGIIELHKESSPWRRRERNKRKIPQGCEWHQEKGGYMEANRAPIDSGLSTICMKCTGTIL